MLIEMDPLLITYLMQSNTSRFLGRRYYVVCIYLDRKQTPRLDVAERRN